ncbi:MAG: YciI family protein [Anaerolineae bacterium]|nr:YciI family protein [Anaerolineae bacterium]
MQYLMLIYNNEAEMMSANPEELQAISNEYWAFTREIQEKGLDLGNNGLQPTSTATTVRVREGKIMTTDGPFAETKEQLAGYYLLNCENLDQAIKYAAKIPSARSGSVEIRPIWEYNTP